MQSEEFQSKNEKDIIKYSKYSRETFYVIKSQNKVIGYCIYYLKPTVSFKGFKKQAVIHLIVIDRNFRGKDFAERLLIESIKEMKLNKISSILLYVNVNNVPAIRLYEKTGFVVVEQTENICGQKEKCYKMELKLQY
nr:GNAT family N-acetyltransferase [Methanosarcina horonobensis]